jgi:hypothetical protein
MQACRNCGSSNLGELGFVGEVAPFFLKRVLNMEIRESVARHPLRLLARRLSWLPQRLFTKVFGSSAFVEMQVCLDCSFVQVKHRFPDEALGRLYADYRTPSYNQERTHYESAYASLAPHVGIGGMEVECRVGGLTSWLHGKIEAGRDFSMLDYGGSDGRFLPRIDANKFVFEISNTTPLPGIIRVATESELTAYSYVQIAHVLEHVTEPLTLLKHVSGFMKPHGYLYIEVPQDLPDAQLAELKAGRIRRGLPIHEHINFYCCRSIQRLVEAAGLNPISVQTTKIDLGWTQGTNIRALCDRGAAG